MSGTVNLENCLLDLESIRFEVVQNFLDILRAIQKKKSSAQKRKIALVVEPQLSIPLGLYFSFSTIKFNQEEGVEKIYHLNSSVLDTECEDILYVVRGQNPSVAQLIAAQITSHAAQSLQKHYYLYFVPKRDFLAEKVLEEEGVYGNLDTIGELHIHLFPLDVDVLSMENESMFKDCFLDGNVMVLEHVANCIVELQTKFGLIPHIKGKGNCAQIVGERVIEMSKELPELAQITSKIGSMLIIDRDVDLLTPMCTQLGYEGLIDELFHIKSSYVELDPECVPEGMKAEAKSKEGVKVILNSNDSLFKEIRDLNFAAVPLAMHRRAKSINEDYQERYKANSVASIKNFISKLGPLKRQHYSIALHANICERIQAVVNLEAFHRRLEVEQSLLFGLNSQNEYIEDCIIRRENMLKTLRLLCMRSLTRGGIKQQHYEQFKREFLQTYGYEGIFTLNNLEKIGLLKIQSNSNFFPNIRKQLHLVNDKIDEHNPNDISYIFSGYAPMSVRLIQLIVKQSREKSPFDEFLKSLPGATFEEVQVPNATPFPHGTVTLLVFLGGITFAEIAALRFWQKQIGKGVCDFIILTTCVTNGDNLVNSLVERVDNKTTSSK